MQKAQAFNNLATNAPLSSPFVNLAKPGDKSINMIEMAAVEDALSETAQMGAVMGKNILAQPELIDMDLLAENLEAYIFALTGAAGGGLPQPLIGFGGFGKVGVATKVLLSMLGTMKVLDWLNLPSPARMLMELTGEALGLGAAARSIGIFRSHNVAVYYLGRLFGIMAADLFQEWMATLKRDVRSDMRARLTGGGQ